MKFSSWVLPIILAIAVYTVFLFISDFAIISDNLQKIKLEYIIPAIIFVFIGLVIRAIRWRLMLQNLEIELNLKSSIAIYFCGTAFGLSPGRLGEVVKSHYLKRLLDVPVKRTAPTIIVERFMDVFAILVIALIAFILIGINHPAVFFGCVLLVVFLIIIYKKEILIRIINKIKPLPLIGKVSNNISDSIDVIYTLLKPKIFIKTLLLSILSWFLESLVIYFVLKSFGIDLSIIKSAFIFVITSLIGSASFLPGGLVTTEGSLVALLLFEGISYNDVVVPIIIIRIITLFMTISFGILINRITEITILKGK